jgi:uncharacterized membrane protein required for colicin V production
VNLLDLAIIVAALTAALGGWRLGVTTRVFAWLGVGLGLLVAVPFVADVVSRFGGDDADTRVTAALIFLVLCGAVGQALGILLGNALRKRRPMARLSARERIGGAALGASGVFVIVWMLLPSLAVASGWPAAATRESFVVSLIESGPAPPAVFEAWGREVVDAPFPEVLDREDEPPDPGDVPDHGLDPALVAKARSSVVHVTGVACNSIIDGSGVIVEPGIVLTNAHVVAGESRTSIIDASGTEHAGTVVMFDAEHDLAVVSVEGLDPAPLPVGDAKEGSIVGIFGHPAGGELRVSPGRVGDTIRATGTDIYRLGRSDRQVVVLAAEVVPGDSGAAVIDELGSIVAIVFATDPASSDTAYALAREEIDAALGRTRIPQGADTMGCVG